MTIQRNASGVITAWDKAHAASHAVGGSDALPAATGRIVQVVNVQTGASATGTTLLPMDNTIPQKTEGDEYMTLAITPTSATNKLKIDVVVVGSHNVNVGWVVALFQDSTSNALAAAWGGGYATIAAATVTFTHYMTAGTTSSTTFKVRAGGYSSGTFGLNNWPDYGAMLGGVAASSITITEVAV